MIGPFYTFYTEAAFLAWLILFEMAIQGFWFCSLNKNYNTSIETRGAFWTNTLLCNSGFLSMGMPVLQAGLWIEGYQDLAWFLILWSLASLAMPDDWF